MPELRGTDPYRPPEARIASDGFERQKVPNKRGFGFLVDVYILGFGSVTLTGCSRCSAPGWRHCCYAIPVDAALANGYGGPHLDDY